MSLNMKTLTQALAKAGAVIEKTVQTTVQDVTGPRPLQDYDLLDQVASGGPGLAWRLFSGRPRSSAPSTSYPLVSVWLLDKRALAEARIRAGLSKAAEDAFLDLVRADAARLVRIRHPGVVHVVQALDENKNAMAMVTEPIFASAANALGNLDNIQKVPEELKGIEMGLLEVKHGLLQLAETLDFLHNNARLVHRAISPETVFITSSGAWKLGGFGFAVSIDQAAGGLTSNQQFHYPEYDVEDSLLQLEPSLNYTAPELVRNKETAARPSCDIFSYGCLAYHLIARKPVLDCHNNVKMYMNTLPYLSSESFSVIPLELIGDMQRMLSMNETARPTALEFTGSSFFRDDTRLRALRFLDHLLERDNMQKSDFLKALSDMWKDFDSRVLRYKVLPPLCSELRNMVLQPVILPMVLTIAESQDKHDFELSTLPALIPVLSSASGETLLLLLKHAELIINKVNQDDLILHVLPLLVRAYDDTDPRVQEEVLRKTLLLTRKLDPQLVKQAILPRVHGLALKTTVAAVRVNSLRCLGDLVPSLDKQAIMDILQTLQRCTAVDRSAPTLICTLGAANSIYKQCGLEFAAEHIIPLLFPLLTAQQLNVQQFAKFVLFVKDVLRKIEEKRGVTITDSGTTEVGSQNSSANGVYSETFPRLSGNNLSGKSNRAWDEDWSSTTKITSNTSLPMQSNLQMEQSSTISQPAPASSSLHSLSSTASQQPSLRSVSSTASQQPSLHSVSSTASQQPSLHSVSSTASQQPSLHSLGSTVCQQPSLHSSNSTANHQPSSACAPVNIEWPPLSSSSGFDLNTSINEKQKNEGLSGSSFDDFDPFANWPPKPSNSASCLGPSKAPTQSGSISGSNMSNVSISSNFTAAQSKPFHGSLSSTATNENGPGWNTAAIGQFNKTTSVSSAANPGPSIGSGNSSNNSYSAKKTDIGMIFASSNNGQPTPRIAPPPASAIGRGQGRGQGNTGLQKPSSSVQAKVASEQPPLLDLL